MCVHLSLHTAVSVPSSTPSAFVEFWDEPHQEPVGATDPTSQVSPNLAEVWGVP